jgi:hypothetical protein
VERLICICRLVSFTSLYYVASIFRLLLFVATIYLIYPDISAAVSLSSTFVNNWMLYRDIRAVRYRDLELVFARFVFDFFLSVSLLFLFMIFVKLIGSFLKRLIKS